jgi:hypothetical protein
MRRCRTLLTAAALLLGAAGAAAAQAPGRYQVVAAPGGGDAPPSLVMVDTATGQSWILVQTPGPPVQWAPVRFWTPGSPPQLAPLPPAPGAVGSRPAGN